MSSENVLWVVLEIKDRNNILVAGSLEPVVGLLSLIGKTQIALFSEDRVLEKLAPFLEFLILVAEENRGQVAGGFVVALGKDLNLGIHLKLFRLD